MNRKSIKESDQRRLYAESMGRCMNPDCQHELFIGEGDIIEKAHIVSYCTNEDNSFENLIILCPNCHTIFDKLGIFNIDEVREWKQIRKKQLETLFSKKFASFDELKEAVEPLLEENRRIYQNYFLGDKKELWNKFEGKVLSNNEQIRMLLESNLSLIQSNDTKEYSNLEVIKSFLFHVDEFKCTRSDDEKIRNALFPDKINSIFGIAPVKESLLQSTESLEEFFKKMRQNKKEIEVVIGVDEPYILMKDDKSDEQIFLSDTPRLRQLYFNNKCFRKTIVRLESLNFVMKYIKSRGITFKYKNPTNLREIIINNVNIIFVYEYCVSKVFLIQLSPEENTVIVNLYNWNKELSISNEAYDFSRTLHVTLLTLEDFYEYIHKLKNIKQNY